MFDGFNQEFTERALLKTTKVTAELFSSRIRVKLHKHTDVTNFNPTANQKQQPGGWRRG